MPPRRPRKRRQGLSTGLPQKADLWAFVSDYTQQGDKLRAFNLIDECTRECYCIRSDNWPEFIVKGIERWLEEN